MTKKYLYLEGIESFSTNYPVKLKTFRI